MSDQKANGWIKCSERLPEETGRYWVAFESGETYFRYFTPKDGFYHPSHDSDYSITHWMPLPTPPVEEKV